ncbi:MAG: hypothetical protein RID91_13475 [Azospirillaceae bacterium]
MMFGGFSALLILFIGLLVGFVGGWWWRGRDGAVAPGSTSREGQAPASRPAPAPSSAPAASPPPAPAAKPAPAPAPASGDGHRPPALAAAEGKADDLKRISGIGPKLEKTLNDLGIFHFRQIATLEPAEVAWLDTHLSFPGRIEREDWIGQARRLATDSGG